MTITLLLDLDDTLLDTRIETFLPTYLDALGRHLEKFAPPRELILALRRAVQAMQANVDPTRTLRDVFDASFYPELHLEPASVAPAVHEFYTEVFPALGAGIRPHLGAMELIDWAMQQGYQLALATDPLFPRLATEERVRWAGMDPSWFSVVSTYETFHFSKGHAAYFAEMLGRLGWPDQPIVMAGDDPARDMESSRLLGLQTFRVNNGLAEATHVQNEPDAATQPSGTLLDLREWLESATLEPIAAEYKTRESVLAVLQSTPGALEGLTSALSPNAWRTEPSKDDWAIIELVCHLRDTEREVHAAQLQTLMVAEAPFVARPDAAVWAKQRRYLDEDGARALRSFAQSRAALILQVEQTPSGIWQKPARHAIFGPTTFGEVLGFMADHDRLHLQQAKSTLAALETAAHPS
jgi:FMN phosphatase YigB (HAD superfamily)